VSGEVFGCQQIEIDKHRWYADIRITLEDGTDIHKVYAATNDDLAEFDNVADAIERLEGG
jgi:hypothetical protein